ncbi:MAG: Lhr family helicase, partial [Candidatus Binatia bacterium]
VQPGSQLHGRDGVLEVIRQLEGLELPGPAWERDVLPARIAHYDPDDLERLCLAGEVVWGRLAVASAASDDESRDAAPARRRSAPTRSAPLAFALRQDLPLLLAPVPENAKPGDLSPVAGEVYEFLVRRGASFLGDLARGLRRLPNEVEDALWELVASGLVTGDGIAGLRTLLLPEEKRQSRKRHLRALPGRGGRRLMPVGRWSLLRTEELHRPPADALESRARFLLRRYGVVVRELLARERRAPSWRDLVPVLRRLEARGEVRGGRFVDGLLGEQFALAEAVDSLRSVRRSRAPGEVVLVAAADPLNLVGTVVPGARVSPYSGLTIAYRDGVPVEIGELGEVRSKLQRG